MEKGEWGRRGGEREWGRRGVRREGESVCEGEREGGKKRGREGGGGSAPLLFVLAKVA